MKIFLVSRKDINFADYDIVQAIIENEKYQFAETNWKFEVILSLVTEGVGFITNRFIT